MKSNQGNLAPAPQSVKEHFSYMHKNNLGGHVQKADRDPTLEIPVQ